MRTRKYDKWYRTRAITLVRCELSWQGRVPHRVGGRDARVVLDEIAVEGSDVYTWYMRAGAALIQKWVTEWDAWAKVEIDHEQYTGRIQGPKPHAGEGVA